MYPILIKIGPVTSHTYGFLLAVGILIAILMIQALGKKENIDNLSNFFFYFMEMKRMSLYFFI